MKRHVGADMLAVQDGSMSVMPCDPEDMAVVKPFIWEVKTK